MKSKKKQDEFVKTSDGHLFKKDKHECFKNSSNFIVGVLEQQTFTCSKSTLETLKNDVKKLTSFWCFYCNFNFFQSLLQCFYY